jgi:hypothetical protein
MEDKDSLLVIPHQECLNYGGLDVRTRLGRSPHPPWTPPPPLLLLDVCLSLWACRKCLSINAGWRAYSYSGLDNKLITCGWPEARNGNPRASDGAASAPGQGSEGASVGGQRGGLPQFGPHFIETVRELCSR